MDRAELMSTHRRWYQGSREVEVQVLCLLVFLVSVTPSSSLLKLSAW